MSKDIATRVLQDEKSFKAFKNLLLSGKEILNTVITDRLKTTMEGIEKSLKVHEINLIFNERDVLKGGWTYSGFWFSSPKMNKINVKMSFTFNVGNGFQNFIFGFSYVNLDNKKVTDETDLSNLFKNKFLKSTSSPNWPCYRTLDEYKNWEDWTTLQNIYFRKEHFHHIIKSIVEEMLAIVDSVVKE